MLPICLANVRFDERVKLRWRTHLAAVSFACHACGLMRMLMGWDLFRVCLSSRACFSDSWSGVRGWVVSDDELDEEFVLVSVSWE